MASKPGASLSESRQASLLTVAPSAPAALDLHLGMEKYRLLWHQASESASDVPSCRHGQTVCHMSGMA
jgi:hypothetical protein